MKKILLFIMIIFATSCVAAKDQCINFDSKKKQCVDIQIYNPVGVEIRSFVFKAEKGMNHVNLDNSIEENGVYFVVIRYSDNEDAPYWTKTVKLDITKIHK